METEILITKASGEQEPFSEKHLASSLRKAGADEASVHAIVAEVKLHLYPGISTKRIYRDAFRILRERSRHLAAKYNLKRAILELGPSGFPFEKFVAQILRAMGFETVTGQIIEGKCVKHEIDVIAKRDNHLYMVECKFHNRQGIICDVKIPLYIQARFKDVEAKWKEEPEGHSRFYQGWTVTNTRFSSDAIQYGHCAGLNMLGWDFPSGKGLKDLIDLYRLYPVTCLTSLKKQEKEFLLENDLLLAGELCDKEDLLRKLNIRGSRRARLLEEAQLLCRESQQAG
ncbi:MAG: restriction endonuclease [Bacteroidia bacterium]|nr:restriction endonuclease [Bacteroidia bacterium]